MVLSFPALHVGCCNPTSAFLQRGTQCIFAATYLFIYVSMYLCTVMTIQPDYSSRGEFKVSNVCTVPSPPHTPTWPFRSSPQRSQEQRADLGALDASMGRRWGALSLSPGGGGVSPPAPPEGGEDTLCLPTTPYPSLARSF